MEKGYGKMAPVTLSLHGAVVIGNVSENVLVWSIILT
jgi:hypothetical protein